jgi:16S rRNA (guanine527-N7)-methyltransferase
MSVDVSRETEDLLRIFADLVLKWTPKINLVSKSDAEVLWDRHIRDSLQLIQLANAPRHWLDLGSGGGFPAIVVASYAKVHWPQTRFTLIESDKRKAAYLRTAVRELALNADVLADRIETASSQNADVISARALADLTSLLSLASRHISPRGVCLFHKGAGWRKELEEAQQSWTFSFEAIKSQTQPDAVILKIEGASRD